MYRQKILILVFVLICIAGHLSASIEEPVPVRFSIPYSAQTAPYTVIVPFTPLGRLILLQAKVNDQEGNFILDTGANGLVLNEQYFDADRLLTNTIGYGISGAINQVGELKPDSFQLDELLFSDVRAQIIDLTQIETEKKTRILGLIGYELLKDFEIMFHYRRSYLTFSRLNKSGNMIDPLPHTLDKQDSVVFVLGSHIPVIEVKVGGKTKRMGIDTGAEYNLLNKKTCKDVLKHFEVLKKISITAADKKNAEVLAGKLSKVQLMDRYPCGSMSTLLINFNQLNRIYKTRLDGILGYQFLAPWLFSVNYRKKQLFLHKLKFTKP